MSNPEIFVYGDKNVVVVNNYNTNSEVDEWETEETEETEETSDLCDVDIPQFLATSPGILIPEDEASPIETPTPEVSET